MRRLHGSVAQEVDPSGRRHQASGDLRRRTAEFDLSSNRATDRDGAPNLGDLNNNYGNGLHDASYETARNRIDEHEKSSDTESEVFMEVCGNEDWMPRYEDTVWPPEGNTKGTTGVDEIRDDVDTVERGQDQV